MASSSKLAIAKARLQNYRTAEEYILTGGASYTLSDNGMVRTVTQANLKWIQSAITQLEKEVEELEAEAAGTRIKRGFYRGV